MADTYNPRFFQVKSLNGNTGANFVGSTNFQWQVPQNTVMDPNETYLSMTIQYDYTATANTFGVLPDGVGFSNNMGVCFWDTSELQMNNQVISDFKNIPQVCTMERLCFQDKFTNDTVRTKNPITLFEDYSFSILCANNVGTVDPDVLSYRNHYLQNAKLIAGEASAAGAWPLKRQILFKVPTGTSYGYHKDPIQGNTRLYLTIGIDSNWRYNVFAAADGTNYTIGSGPSSTPATTATTLRIDVTDLTLWVALKSTDVVPRSVSHSYDIIDLASSTYSVNGSTVDQQLTVPQGTSMLLIGFATSNRGVNINYSPTNFRTQINQVLQRLYVTFNSRQLVQPPYQFTPSAANNAITNGSTIRTLADDADWGRAWQDFITTTQAYGESSMYTYNTWLASPVFAFNLSRSPGEQSNDLLIHLDLNAFDTTTVGLQCTMYMTFLQNKRVTVEYNADSQPVDTSTAYIR